MSYTRLHYGDVEPVSEGMHFLRDPLDCEQVGVTIVEVSPGWTGKPHDHAEDGQEEVYVCLEGGATLTIDGRDVPMEEGDAIRIDPEATRQIHNGDAESRFVLVGAP